jgi:hypothetical protein
VTYDHWKASNPDDDFLGPKTFLCERCGTFCEPDKDAASKGWLCEECAKIKKSPP